MKNKTVAIIGNMKFHLNGSCNKTYLMKLTIL